jgi:hypothetical protein
MYNNHDTLSSQLPTDEKINGRTYKRTYELLFLKRISTLKSRSNVFSSDLKFYFKSMAYWVKFIFF